MPRVIVHIGMPKTGTTALQTAMGHMRPVLAEAGLFFPETVNANHDILSVGSRPFGSLTRQYQQIYRDDPARARADFDRWWNRLLSEVEASKPDLVLLSGESLFSDEGAPDLRRILGQIGDDITVVAYLRRPSSFFLSSIQQRLKASRRIGPFEILSYRSVLEHYEQSFRCEVAAYDPATLASGDIVADFFSRFAPEFDLPAAYEPRRTNESLSAEAMALIQDFRRVCAADQEFIYTPETHYLIAAIRAVTPWCPQPRPVLKPGLAERIDHSNPDLLWLQQRWGVTFSGLDYGRAAQEEPPYAELLEGRVEDICEVDPEVRSRLTLMALANLARRANQASQAARAGAVPVA